MLFNLKNTSFCVTVVYRPPPSKANKLRLKCFWKDWKDLLTLHTTSNFDFVIVGDLNLHLDETGDCSTLKFQTILDEFSLTQHIHEKTHVAGHTLDILVTNSNSNIVSQICVHDPNFCTDSGQPVKDHFIIKWLMQGCKKKVKPEKFTFRDWKKICHEDFDQDISLAFNKSSETSSDLVNTYCKVLNDLKEAHAPAKTVTKTRKLNPWYNSALKEMKTKQRQLERKAKKSKSEFDNNEYKKICYAYYNHLRICVIDYNKKLIADNASDQKKLHSIANKLLGNSKKVKYPESESNKQLADSFMKFFNDKVQGIRENFPVAANQFDEISVTEVSPPQLSFFRLATVTEVKSLIRVMPSKHCKLDPIPTWVAKLHLDELAPIITVIINESLENGIVHPYLKAAIVRPIIKSSSLDYNIKDNFRPVSNLPFLAKVLEKVVYDRINTHLLANNLLPSNQSAYKKYHSTETVLLKIQDDILTSLDQDKVVALVMLDISAAFDTVDHQRLLNCFSSCYGFSGTALRWMESYLSGRTQKVVIEDTESFTSLMENGFPQGAVLAGLLYNMYSGPLHTEIKKHNTEHHGYADDNNLYIAFAAENMLSSVELLKQCVDSTKDWLNLNLLQVNDSKTKIIYFTPKKSMSLTENSIVVGSSSISPSANVKYLGVYLDSLLNLECHVNKITSSAYFHLRNISKIRQVLDISSTKSLIQSTVTSRIDYCNSLLSNAPQRLTNKLQRIQNHAARVIYKKRKRDHITPVLKELHWLPIRCRVSFKVLLITFKCLNGLAPEYLADLIKRYSPPRVLRSNDSLSGTLIVPRFKKLKHGGRSFSTVAPSLWNCLPSDIRNADTVSLFKSMLKTHMFKEYYNC